LDKHKDGSRHADDYIYGLIDDGGKIFFCLTSSGTIICDESSVSY